MSTSDQNSIMPFLRNESTNIFEDLFHDDVINKADSYLWSKEEFKIKVEDQNLMLVTFWNMLAVKRLLRNYSN